MNKENLSLFRKYLEGIPNDKYHQSCIRSIGDGCALAHCFGWSTFGLVMHDEEYNPIYLNKDHTWPRLTNWVKDAYGIEPFSEEWEYLFGFSCAGKEEVLSRLDELLNKS